MKAINNQDVMIKYKRIKVTALKLEVVNGKHTGRTYAFYADMKEYGKCKTLTALKKKVREDIVSGRIFNAAELDALRYDIAELEQEWKRIRPLVKEEEAKAADVVNVIKDRITPTHITRLGTKEVFVFGSNGAGRHMGGAASYALEHFGAVMGKGHGPQGKCYAIDTMSGPEVMERDVKAFVEYARKHKDKIFLVTPVGCGIAGLSPSDVAPHFASCKELENVTLPKEFWQAISR